MHVVALIFGLGGIMKLKIVTAVVLAAVLAGCQATTFGVHTDAVVASQRPVTKAEVDKIIRAMRDHLYDPYSVRDAEISQVATANGVPTVCVKANAKNRMGGYVGRQTVMIYMRPNSRLAVNTTFVAGCELFQYRRFHEIEQLKAL